MLDNLADNTLLELSKIVFVSIDVINMFHLAVKGLHCGGDYWLSFFWIQCWFPGKNWNLHVVTFADKFGTAMALVKRDIGRNTSVRCLFMSKWFSFVQESIHSQEKLEWPSTKGYLNPKTTFFKELSKIAS